MPEAQMYPGFGIIRFYHYLCVSNHKSITHTGPLMGLCKIYALRLSERKEYLFSRNDQIPEKDIHLSADSQGEENIDDLYPKEVPREGRLLHLYPPFPPHYPPFPLGRIGSVGEPQLDHYRPRSLNQAFQPPLFHL